MSMCSLLLCCWKRVFAMSSAFSWQNSISLCPAFIPYSKPKFACYSRCFLTFYFSLVAQTVEHLPTIWETWGSILRFNPWVRKISWRREWQSTTVFLPPPPPKGAQRTNPREYQIVRTPTKETTWIQDLYRTTNLNNKQNKNINPIISRQDYHLIQSWPSEEKQRNKQKLSTNPTL